MNVQDVICCFWLVWCAASTLSFTMMHSWARKCYLCGVCVCGGGLRSDRWYQHSPSESHTVHSTGSDVEDSVNRKLAVWRSLHWVLSTSHRFVIIKSAVPSFQLRHGETVRQSSFDLFLVRLRFFCWKLTEERRTYWRLENSSNRLYVTALCNRYSSPNLTSWQMV